MYIYNIIINTQYNILQIYFFFFSIDERLQGYGFSSSKSETFSNMLYAINIIVLNVQRYLNRIPIWHQCLRPIRCGIKKKSKVNSNAILYPLSE